MAKTSVSKRSYPWVTTLNDQQITLRLMQSDDRNALLDFARSVPADDLLFLSVDITEPEAVERRSWRRQQSRTQSLATSPDLAAANTRGQP